MTEVDQSVEHRLKKIEPPDPEIETQSNKITAEKKQEQMTENT